MTKKEFAVMVKCILAYYPNSQALQSPEAVELWYRQLSDIPYEIANGALDRWVASNKWPPTIADIREAAVDLVEGETEDWSEGWEAVIKAIGRWGMHREAEALANMPETARKTVQRLGWQNICLSEDISVERANFRQIYLSISERKKKELQIQRGGIEMKGQQYIESKGATI